MKTQSAHSFFEQLTSGRLRHQFKLLWLRQRGLDGRRMIQVMPVHSQAHPPEEVLEELVSGSGLFRNRATKERFRLQSSDSGIALVEA